MAFMLPVLKTEHPHLVSNPKTRRHSTPANMKPKSSSFIESRHPRLSVSIFVPPEARRQKSQSVCSQTMTATTSMRIPRKKSANNSSRSPKLSCQMEMSVRNRSPSISQATSGLTASPTVTAEPAYSQNQDDTHRRTSFSRKFSLSSSPKVFANFWTLIAKQQSTVNDSGDRMNART